MKKSKNDRGKDVKKKNLAQQGLPKTINLTNEPVLI